MREILIKYIKMDIVKTISGLIEDVYNGDIDSLDELQRELIHLKNELEQLTLTDVVVSDCLGINVDKSKASNKLDVRDTVFRKGSSLNNN